jgi:hypothetical protein
MHEAFIRLFFGQGFPQGKVFGSSRQYMMRPPIRRYATFRVDKLNRTRVRRIV